MRIFATHTHTDGIHSATEYVDLGRVFHPRFLFRRLSELRERGHVVYEARRVPGFGFVVKTLHENGNHIYQFAA